MVEKRPAAGYITNEKNKETLGQAETKERLSMRAGICAHMRKHEAYAVRGAV